MTRFETLDGEQLGVRFAGDNGATFHLTQAELKSLFELDESTEVVSDNVWFGTVGDLLDMWSKGNKVSEEELQRRFKKDLSESLHLQQSTHLLLDSEGELQEGQLFRR